MKSSTEQRTNIGRFARVRLHKYHGQVLVGNVLDLVAGTKDPKRIRIQRGDPSLHGLVVVPTEYDFIGWADEEED